MSQDLLTRLGDAVKAAGSTLTIAWRGDGWYATEYNKSGLLGLWPPAPTLSDAAVAVLVSKGGE
jgi:hypothetical protein